MRNRSLIRTLPTPGEIGFADDGHYTSGLFPDIHSEGVQVNTFNPHVVENSVMADSILNRPQVRVNPATGEWTRIKYPKSKFGSDTVTYRRLARAGQLKPVRPCTHTTTRRSFEKELTVRWQGTSNPGNPVFERVNTRARRFTDASSFLAFLYGADGVDSIMESSSEGAYTASDYRKHDWFALMSRFDEACDQFLPSSFMGGEDLAQNAIFVDAFKLVLNPTRAIPILLNMGRNVGYHKRRGNLGGLVKYLLRQSANANLLWNFALKPAISDIGHALSAHQKVSQRMRVLRDHAGAFVPVRVRGVIPSQVENSPLSMPSGTESPSFEWQCSSKESIATISSWGRVREDLNFGDDWSAYLQYFGINKVVGLAWELIPFTFVLDWFTNAQEQINQLTRFRTGGPFTEFRNFCASEKQTLTEDLYCVPGWDNSFAMPMITPDNPFKVATRVTSSYNRYTKIPDTSGVVDLSTLGLFHILMSGSILLQRLLK